MSTQNSPKAAAQNRADNTRHSLLDAATQLFAQDGFASVSNRTLAEAANVNQALIGYHFGSKQGLYLAIFQRLADDLGERLGPVASEVEVQLALLVSDSCELTIAEKKASSIDTVSLLLGAHVRLLMEPGMENYAKLIIREQLEPTPAFEIMWKGILGKLLRLVTRLVALASARQSPNEEDHLLALTLIGQAIVFRVARATVVHQLGWPDQFESKHIVAVDARICANVKLLLEDSRL